MSQSQIRLTILVALPLLVFALFFLFVSDSGPESEDATFTHPQIPVGSQMLRTQPDGTLGSAAGDAPSSENVSDSYFHQIFVLEEQIKLNASDTLAMRQLGRLLQDGHRMLEADLNYSNYLEMRPRARQVWLDLAATRAADERWEPAKDAVRDMLEVYPGDEFAIYNLGAISANAGDFTEARKVWQGLVDTGSDNTVVSMATLSITRLTEQN